MHTTLFFLVHSYYRPDENLKSSVGAVGAFMVTVDPSIRSAATDTDITGKDVAVWPTKWRQRRGN